MMAELPDNVTVKLELHGVDKLSEGLQRVVVELRSYRERLIQIGWTPSMADGFLGDVAETITRELVKGLTLSRVSDQTPELAVEVRELWSRILVDD